VTGAVQTRSSSSESTALPSRTLCEHGCDPRSAAEITSWQSRTILAGKEAGYWVAIAIGPRSVGSPTPSQPSGRISLGVEERDRQSVGNCVLVGGTVCPVPADDRIPGAGSLQFYLMSSKWWALFLRGAAHSEGQQVIRQGRRPPVCLKSPQRAWSCPVRGMRYLWIRGRTTRCENGPRTCCASGRQASHPAGRPGGGIRAMVVDRRRAWWCSALGGAKSAVYFGLLRCGALWVREPRSCARCWRLDAQPGRGGRAGRGATRPPSTRPIRRVTAIQDDVRPAGWT